MVLFSLAGPLVPLVGYPDCSVYTDSVHEFNTELAPEEFPRQEDVTAVSARLRTFLHSIFVHLLFLGSHVMTLYQLDLNILVKV